MQKSLALALMSIVVVVAARESAAQPVRASDQRGYVNFSIGFDSTPSGLSAETTRTIYDETASLSVAQGIEAGVLVDVAGGVRVWRNVTVGVGFHSKGSDSGGSVVGAIPHPLFIDRPRPLTLEVADLNRHELGVHFQFGYLLPLGERLRVHLSAGPSLFRLRQEVIEDVALIEAAPFTTVTGTPTIVQRVDTPTGFNIGVDVAYDLYSADLFALGGGMFVRYAGASGRIRLLDNVVDSDLGGLQVGFGIRTRF